MLSSANQGHPGSVMSQIEILVSLYYGGIIKYTENDPKNSNNDKIIISKGHAAMSLYPIFADIGYFDEKELKKFGTKGCLLKIFGNINIPGIDATSGSLGHGLGIGAGLCFSFKKSKVKNKSYVVISEGEMYEGSTWESAMFASHHNLNNLIVILDRNNKMILGDTEECLKLEPISSKWESFGFNVFNVDGHSIEELLNVFNNISSVKNNKPSIIIANTVKGKGISFMENDPNWHYWHNLNEDKIKQAIQELDYE